MSDDPERPIGWRPEWVVLDCWEGKVVLPRDNVALVQADGMGPIVILRHGLSHTTGDGYLRVLALDGESPSDALARVCALLGIEVQR